GTATNAMCTFLALNTSSVQLIPTTAIAILVAAGSTNPTAIVGTSLLATLCAATVAIVSVKLLEKLPWFRFSPNDVANQAEPAIKSEAPLVAGDLALEQTLRRVSRWGWAALTLLVIFFLALFVRQIFPEVFPRSGGALPLSPNLFVRAVSALSLLAIPLLLAFFILYAALCGLKVYDEFVEGAKEGFGVILRIIPFLVTMLVAINMFKGAGGIDLLARALAPVLGPLHFPTDLLPIALMRPLSGGATLALFTDVVHRLGPDNIVSLMAATIYGSTETTFYVAAVYFGSVGIRQTRHAIPAGLLADFTGVVASVLICRAVL
ncbi:MAG TPA: nucleoside recognition domain-containing protein, partial [Chthoniobacterales bacterium]